MKLSSRLICLFLITSLVPLSVISYLAYVNGIRTIKQDTFDRLVSVNTLKAAEVTRWINSSRSYIQALAQRPLVREYAIQLTRFSLSDEEQIQSIKKSLLKEHFEPSTSYDTGFLHLSIINSKDGRIIVSTEQSLEGRYRNNRVFFKKGQVKTYVDEVVYEVGLEELTMHISTPIIGRDGQTVAVLAGHLDWQELSQIMLQGRERSRSEESYLVNKFFYFVTETRFMEGNPLKRTNYTMGVEHCLQKEDGVELYDDYRMVPIIGAYKWMDKWNLCILTEKDQAEAFEPIEAFRKMYIAVAIAAAFLASILSILFTRTVTKRVDRLVNGAEEIGKGNLEHRLTAPGNDELDQLARSFNKMAGARQKAEERIQKAHDQLEQRVKERTSEITDKNLQLIEEIQERNQAEIALRKSENEYRTLVNSLETAVVVHSPDMKIILSNIKSHELLALNKAQMTGKESIDPAWHLTRENGSLLPTEEYPVNVVEATRKPLRNYTMGIKVPEVDTLTWVSVNAFPVFDEDENLLQIVVTFWDISYQKEAAEKLKKSLTEKEVLLREIHHRVKNNMQMIQSLINLQARKMESQELNQALVDSNSRIKSMALIHETLYRSEDLANLKLEEYFHQLVRHLIKVYNTSKHKIETAYEIEPITLDMDQSIACGLIINELVTNALKYAFLESKVNKIIITLNRVGSNEAQLVVADNGRGLPDDMEEFSGQSLGLKIVDMLAVDQLQGTISIDSVSGTHFQIRFPL